jgi:hypothetical protein
VIFVRLRKPLSSAGNQETDTENRSVGGSIPPLGTIFRAIESICYVTVAGPRPGPDGAALRVGPEDAIPRFLRDGYPANLE